MPKKVALISCVSKKLEIGNTTLVKAKDLYISPLFIKAWTYAVNTIKADKIFILSAKHHLLHPDTLIGYYNETLTKGKTAREIKEWSNIVAKQLEAEGINLYNDEIYILAGSKYYKYLIPQKQPNIKLIYEGMPIGKILQFLDAENSK
ncbi:MAG: hypothetical protein J6R71_02865 [Bacteroidales bacterium]|nr:hypothetical protein [Bacteroidales bacterium]MBO5846586.1 hypothetical protein [Bacteroidales bacterium]